MAGTHADVRRIIPEGLSIGVDEMRAIVADRLAAAQHRPLAGRRDRGCRPAHRGCGQRAAEGGGGAAAVDGVPAVRAVGGPRGHRDHPAVAVPARGAGDAVDAAAIAQVLIDARRARRRAGARGRRRSAAVTSAGPAGWPPIRRRGNAAPGHWAWPATPPPRRGPTRRPRNWWPPPRPRPGRSNVGRDEAEAEELRTALGAGGTGKGTAGALRGAAGALKDLEKRQKSRQTRASRDALDRALIDLATYFRDALLVAGGAGAVTANHPDMAEQVAAMAAHASPERLLRCIEAVLECREALAMNVKPKFAVDAHGGHRGPGAALGPCRLVPRCRERIAGATPP